MDSTPPGAPTSRENSAPEEAGSEKTQILPPITDEDDAETAPKLSLPKPPPPETRPERDWVGLADEEKTEDPDSEDAETEGVETEGAPEAPADKPASEEPGPVPPPPAQRERSARDQRPLPWDPDAPRAGRVRPDADADRRREIILEKASAIEAATAASPDASPDEAGDEEDDLYTYIPPYSLPSRDPDPPAQKSDFHRQIFVSIGAVASFITMLWMFGAFGQQAILGGGALDELLEGWYSGEQALLSPDANFFWLWPVVVSAIIAHTVFQWQSTQKSTPRQQRSGWRIGLASLLMLVWTAAVYAELLTVAVLAALATALALMDAVRQLNFHTARSSTERRLTDATAGLFAGWALVLAMASVSVWLTAVGIRIPGVPALPWALIGLLLCIWVGAFYSMTERGRITIAMGLGWGMFWLIFPRLLSDLTSVGVAIGAAMGAFIVILATESRRHRINHAERRAAMGRPVEDII
ncbi:hypothetical protein [Nesterenkonia cremea]|uniref:Uncharacterized protein n=1 Tax=Nesterenkonia cremea TaxID=1882340 RepID=A0A917ASU5_9MICC|nr:hypothetical protein [Nesterenkonia cremea]GGE71503.1 hypothetical protein GCM10011401_18200 [Nesterenkonia cremea]